MTPRQRLVAILTACCGLPPALLLLAPWLVPALRKLVGQSRKIVVFGGHGGEAFDDNSRALALHYVRDRGYKVYWVYRTASVKQKARAAGLIPVRRFGLRTELVINIAHAAFNSHGFSDLSVPTFRPLPWRRVIYLGHGVWGFKRVERRGGFDAPKSFDVTICVSDQERTLKSEVLGVPRSRIICSGLPKHDALCAAQDAKEPAGGGKLVLFAPTWRDWLQHKPSQTAIDTHFGAIRDLVDARPKTDGHGDSFDITYLLHRNINVLEKQAQSICRSYELKCLESSATDVNRLLRRADYLITDYSALFWDFIIQNKPAARYLFDKQIYQALTGGYAPIESMAQSVSFTDPAKAWSFLFSPAATKEAEKIAHQALPFSTGTSCRRIKSEIEGLTPD